MKRESLNFLPFDNSIQGHTVLDDTDALLNLKQFFQNLQKFLTDRLENAALYQYVYTRKLLGIPNKQPSDFTNYSSFYSTAVLIKLIL